MPAVGDGSGRSGCVSGAGAGLREPPAVSICEGLHRRARIDRCPTGTALLATSVPAIRLDGLTRPGRRRLMPAKPTITDRQATEVKVSGFVVVRSRRTWIPKHRRDRHRLRTASSQARTAGMKVRHVRLRQGRRTSPDAVTSGRGSGAAAEQVSTAPETSSVCTNHGTIQIGRHLPPG